jgi:hypothetical protein
MPRKFLTGAQHCHRHPQANPPLCRIKKAHPKEQGTQAPDCLDHNEAAQAGQARPRADIDFTIVLPRAHPKN